MKLSRWVRTFYDCMGIIWAQIKGSPSRIWSNFFWQECSAENLLLCEISFSCNWFTVVLCQFEWGKHDTYVLFWFGEFTQGRQSFNGQHQCATPATAVMVTNIKAAENIIRAIHGIPLKRFGNVLASDQQRPSPYSARVHIAQSSPLFRKADCFLRYVSSPFF